MILALSRCGYSYNLHGRTIPELLHFSLEPNSHCLNTHAIRAQNTLEQAVSKGVKQPQRDFGNM